MLLLKLKRMLLNNEKIVPEIYRPLIYWLYLINPFKETGKVIFPSLENMDPILNNLQLNVKDIVLKRSELEAYISQNIHEYWHYFSTGYGKAFVGKAAEHFVSMQLSNFREGILIDIAAELSPFVRVVTKIYPEAEVYQQDLIYKGGIHGFQIGGNATHLPVDDSSINLMTLHNSIEHFEGNDDSLFVLECARVLKKGGEVIILPVFFKKEPIQYINPTINPEGLRTDEETRKIYVYSQPRFMRHYSADTFTKRILRPAQDKFKIELFRIVLLEDFIEKIELALALRLTRI